MTAIASSVIAGFGLAQHHNSVQGPFGAQQWVTLLEQLAAQRILGLAVAADADGSLVLTAAQRDELLTRLEGAMASALHLEALLVDVWRTLRAAGIDARVLKGSAAAHLDYPKADWRSFGDVDLLVRGNDFDAAARLLVERGFTRRFDEPRAGFTARFGKGACFVAPNGLELDLHRSFVAGPFVAVGDDERLWSDPQQFTVAGEQLVALAHDVRLVHAAMHAVLGKRTPRLVPLRDTLQLCATTVEPSRLTELAHSLGVGAVLARAVLTARATLRVSYEDEIARWALHYQPSHSERLSVRAYTEPNRSYFGQVRAGLRTVRGASAKLSYASALLFPDPDYLAHRERSYRRRLLRALTRGARGE